MAISSFTYPSTWIPISSVSFISPLLEEGYPPVVDEYRSNKLKNKPLLLYLPGFDGTLLAPFLQFPELSTEFDVKGMIISMKDRSTLKDLQKYVIDYLYKETEFNPSREVYLTGESFGGILALSVALQIKEFNKIRQSKEKINLQGLVAINPATSYDRSKLAKYGPPIANGSPLFYPFALLTLLPLFTDNVALSQLLLILQSKGLPSVIDSCQREAYMGRVAFSLPKKLQFMPQATLKWRLEEWLSKGCELIHHQEEILERLECQILIVAGENDETLPSVDEAKRLSSFFKDAKVHIVDKAGHACTSGSRVDLTALMRSVFPNVQKKGGRTQMKCEASMNEGVFFGLEKRYDNASIGLSPFLYWSKDNYVKV